MLVNGYELVPGEIWRIRSDGDAYDFLIVDNVGSDKLAMVGLSRGDQNKFFNYDGLAAMFVPKGSPTCLGNINPLIDALKNLHE